MSNGRWFFALILTVGLLDFAKAQIPMGLVVAGLSLNSNGQLQAVMSDGSTQWPGAPTVSGDATGNTLATVVALQKPAYATVQTVTSGATISLPSGYSIYPLTGSGLIAAATIRLPSSPVDRQIARIAFQGALAVTALTFTDSAGNSITNGTISNLGTFASATFQQENGSWARIGS